MDTTRETILTGLEETVYYYMDLTEDRQFLSKQQREQLEECVDRLSAFTIDSLFADFLKEEAEKILQSCK